MLSQEVSMNSYEYLQEKACKDGVDVIDYPFNSSRIRGLYCNGTVAIRQNMTTAEKSCVLAEELGHHYTTAGDILNQTDTENRKQELRARLWAYNNRIGLLGIIEAFKARRTAPDEMADFLEVSPEFLQEALECYRSKYSPHVKVDNYILFFEPCLAVMETLR